MIMIEVINIDSGDRERHEVTEGELLATVKVLGQDEIMIVLGDVELVKENILHGKFV